jgi:hypothetical protein
MGKWVVLALTVLAMAFVADYLTSPMPPIVSRSTI